MKKYRLFALPCIVFFFSTHLFAQDITGLWKGRLYDDTVKQYIPYEIAISESNGKLNGYSYAIIKGEKGDETSLKSIKIKKKEENKFEIEDDDIVSSSYFVPPSKRVKKTIELNLVIKDSVMMMAGSWTTNWTKKYHPVTGTIELQRKNDYWHADPLIQKLDTMKLSTNLSFVKIRMQPETADVTKNNVSSPIAKVTPVLVKQVITAPAAEVAERKTSAIQTVFFKSDSLSLTLYDNGEVDGDTVSILLGGKIIFSKQGLSEKPVTKTIYTKDIPDSTTLIWYAENLGSIPPNTGLLILYDGETRHEIFFSADLHTNASLILSRKKN